MPKFTGMLSRNEVFGAMFNMIISQEVFSDNINKTNRLVDRARVDGGLYGDTKIYYATDVLKSDPWGADAEAINLLQLHRPKNPEVQAIKLDVFRQIPLTIDYYLSKRAWGDEGAFAQFTAVTLQWLRDTKEVIDSTTYNAFIGTAKGAGAGQSVEIDLTGITATGEEGNRLRAQTIAESIANLVDELGEPSRKFNDYKFLRSYREDQIIVVWNSAILNKITKLDLPTVYHNDALFGSKKDKLNSRYFGTKNTSGGTSPVSNTTVRSLVEKDYEVAKTVAETDGELNPGFYKIGSKYYQHLFPGDLLPSEKSYLANETYTVDANIVCKIFVKLPPMMSAFETGTSFFNPKSLTETHFLTWGRNTLECLSGYPAIEVKIKTA